MNTKQLETVAQIESVLNGPTELLYEVLGSKDERYAWVEKTLNQFCYHGLKKPDKGIVVRYLCRMTAYSRQQITRMIARHRETRKVVRRQRTDNGFQKKYTHEDIRLIAHMDSLFNDMSGPGMKKIYERSFFVFNDARFLRLANISASHIYNLRKSRAYTTQRCHHDKTKPTKVKIGERRKPNPNGEPGYLRVDTVHQGDLDKKKGVYHINAVDEVTQMEIVFTVEVISEQGMLPALEAIIKGFPFAIKSFHSDNGSEYINRRVVGLLDKLLIELTKSRARRSNDNALAESKNASVVRKFFGHSHIPKIHAKELNIFNQDHLNPFINFHRPCFFPKITTDNKGKQKKTYPYELICTPYEKLKSLPNYEQYLVPGVTAESLEKIAMAHTDIEAASKLQAARKSLFSKIFNQAYIATQVAI